MFGEVEREEAAVLRLSGETGKVVGTLVSTRSAVRPPTLVVDTRAELRLPTGGECLQIPVSNRHADAAGQAGERGKGDSEHHRVAFELNRPARSIDVLTSLALAPNAVLIRTSTLMVGHSDCQDHRRSSVGRVRTKPVIPR